MSSRSKARAKEKLREAKELLDEGLISQQKYAQIQQQCLIEMELISPPVEHPSPLPRRTESPIDILLLHKTLQQYAGEMKDDWLMQNQDRLLGYLLDYMSPDVNSQTLQLFVRLSYEEKLLYYLLENDTISLQQQYNIWSRNHNSQLVDLSVAVWERILHKNSGILTGVGFSWPQDSLPPLSSVGKKQSPRATKDIGYTSSTQEPIIGVTETSWKAKRCKRCGRENAAVFASQCLFCGAGFQKSGRCIGIDLGTANSSVAVWDSGQSVVIRAVEQNSNLVPSVLAFAADGEHLIGQSAVRQAVGNPHRTLYSVKRLLGKQLTDSCVERMKKHVSYSIDATAENAVCIDVDGKTVSPLYVLSVLLEELKCRAENYLGETVNRCVITLPSSFTHRQRQALAVATRMSGLHVTDVIYSNDAAVLAYGHSLQEKQTVAVFDVGGGSFGISIVEIDNGFFQVKATNGHAALGGKDIDDLLISYLCKSFRNSTEVDLQGHPVAMMRLKEAVQRAKHDLSVCETTEVSLPFIASDSDGRGLHLEMSITRRTVDAMVHKRAIRIAQLCKICLRDANLSAADIDTVLLLGGMTNMPKIQRLVEKLFPCSQQRFVPEQAMVAKGAAIWGGVSVGEVRGVALQSVVSLPLGIEVADGQFEEIIPRNCVFPCKASKIFTTASDNQQMIRCKVFQGKSNVAQENVFLGQLELFDLPLLPKGTLQIEVSFALNASQNLHVSAKDLVTNQSISARLHIHLGFSNEDITEMAFDLKRYHSKSMERQQLTAAKDQLEVLIYRASRAYENSHALHTMVEQERISAVLDSAEDALESSSLDKVQNAYAALLEAPGVLPTIDGSNDN